MKNAKKILGILFAVIALALVMSLSIFAEETCEHNFEETSRVEPTSTTAPGKIVFTCSECGTTDEKDIELFEFNSPATYLTAYKAADEYDILRMTADTTFDQMNGEKNGSSLTPISKPIVIDLGGFTLTTTSGYGGVYIGGGASMINGTIFHTGNTCAIKACNVDRFEDFTIIVESVKSNTGAISTRNHTGDGGYAHINVIKNVKMQGTGNYGIETYDQGDSNNKTRPVIDLMENVEIDSITYGLDLSVGIGTIKDCTISGSVAGICTKEANGFVTAIRLVGDNKIMGGDAAVKVASGKIILSADKYTNFEYTNDGGMVFDIPESSAASSTFNIVGYTVEGNVFTECAHVSTGGSCTERAECSVCTKALGYTHNYVEDTSKREPANCTVQGKAYYNCNCGAEKEEFIPRDPNAHDWLITTVEATCTVDGSVSYNCKYGSCVGEEYVDPIVAPGHDMVIDEPAVPATCTETGWTSAEHCKNCEEATTTQRKTSALGHDTIVDAAVAATCSNTGLTEGSHCSRCDDATVAQTPTAALGHDIATRAAVAPTCTATGLTEGKYCTRGCDSETVTQAKVDALGHNIITDKAAIAPTCTGVGWTEGKRCSRCDKATVAQKEVAALGHSWLDATTEAPKTCSVCATTQGIKLPTPTDDAPASDDGEGLSTGAIAGIIAGSVVVVGAGGFSLYWFVFRKRFI